LAPRSPQVQDGGSLCDEFCLIGDAAEAGDSIVEIVQEVDSQFSGCSRQGHEGVPGFGSILNSGAEADHAFADPAPGGEFCIVIVEREFRMIQYQQQRVLFGPCFGDPLVEGVIAGSGGKYLIKEMVEPDVLAIRWRLTVC